MKEDAFDREENVIESIHVVFMMKVSSFVIL